MGRGLLFLFVMSFLTAILCGNAEADTYRYTDDKGVIHLTDNPASIPGKYRSSALKVQVDNRTEGYTPSLQEAIGSERFSSDAWFKYSGMPFYERWFLLARAGLMDIKPILKVMAPWIGIAVMILAVAYFYIFKLFDAPAKKGAMLLLVFAVVAGGLFCKYIRVVEGQSAGLLRKVQQLRSMNENLQRKALDLQEGSPSGER